MSRPRVVIARGHQANSWHLRPWRHLSDRFDVVALRTRSNWFDTRALGFRSAEVAALRDLLPRGRVFDQVVRIPGDRYVSPADAFAGASIVHAQDLGFWYSMQAARLRRRLGYKLVLTVWETIPFLHAYRNVRTRRYRDLVLRETDLFLAATSRAAACLRVEGAPVDRIRVCAPGVDRELFDVGSSAVRTDAHLILSAGRLVWEKGHQDLLRAVSALRRGVDGLQPMQRDVRVMVIGAGPEEQRLRSYAAELGIGDLVEIHSEVPYLEMPALYARASCLVLASLPVWSWEEQFGMVLAEAICARLPVLASDSGAIAEVLRGHGKLFAPGDWLGLAHQLEEGPLSKPAGSRAGYPEALLEGYSSTAAADRLADAYTEVLDL